MGKVVSVQEGMEDLPQLLEQVERGEDVVITRDGLPVARLTQVRVDKTRVTAQEAAMRVQQRMAEGWPIRGRAVGP